MYTMTLCGSILGGLFHSDREEATYSMDAKRGFVPEDERNFAPEAIETLKTASRHIAWLLDEGYDLKKASTFVGNHFLLSERQRMAIVRSVASRKQITSRIAKEIPLEGLSGQEVWIDGFNTIITLEVLLSDSLLFECMDGSIRDLASLRGTYRLISETEAAIRMLFETLQKANVSKINVLLDEPVSNSGRLKVLLAEIGEDFSPDLDIQILRDVDRALFDKSLVITSDSVILDRCKSWTNLLRNCVRREAKKPVKVW